MCNQNMMTHPITYEEILPPLCVSRVLATLPSAEFADEVWKQFKEAVHNLIVHAVMLATLVKRPNTTPLGLMSTWFLIKHHQSTNICRTIPYVSLQAMNNASLSYLRQTTYPVSAEDQRRHAD